MDPRDISYEPKERAKACDSARQTHTSALDALREDLFRGVMGRLAHRTAGMPLGDEPELAAWAFRQSLIGRAFPSFWAEVPLAGRAGYDLHVYYDRAQVDLGARFGGGRG